jgi:hypothetical protein
VSDRNAVQLTAIAAGPDLRFGVARFGERLRGGDRDECVQLGIEGGDAVDAGLSQLQR